MAEGLSLLPNLYHINFDISGSKNSIFLKNIFLILEHTKVEMISKVFQIN